MQIHYFTENNIGSPTVVVGVLSITKSQSLLWVVDMLFSHFSFDEIRKVEPIV